MLVTQSQKFSQLERWEPAMVVEDIKKDGWFAGKTRLWLSLPTYIKL